MAKHLVTFTNDRIAALTDEFDIQRIFAYTDAEADLIMHNVERFFGGITICCDEERPRQRPRKRENSDRRKRAR